MERTTMSHRKLHPSKPKSIETTSREGRPAVSAARPAVAPPRLRGRGPLLLGGAALALIIAACASQAPRPSLGGASGTAAAAPAFDSVDAWRYLQAQLAFGVRPVGAPAHEQLRDYLAAELRKQTADVQL